MPGATRFTPYRKPQEKPTVIGQMIVVELKNPAGDTLGPPLNIASDVTPQQLQLLVKELIKTTTREDLDDIAQDFSFFCDNAEIIRSVQEDVIQGLGYSPESIVTIVYQPQSFFKVKAVTRCSSTLTGHQEAILSVCFSPDGLQLATGSGDTTVRVWDMNTETPQWTLKGHTNWVQIVAWSPDNKFLVSGSMDSTIRLWNPRTGTNIGEPLKAHTQSITAIAWEPFKDNAGCSRFATSSRDCTIKIWSALTRQVLMTLSQHAQPVMCLRWGGEGTIYSGSRDKSIKVWDAKTGKCVKTLAGHAHWVNHIALSTDFALRTGPYDHTRKKHATPELSQAAALERYTTLRGNNPEFLVSCSDDFTLFLWEDKPICRMTGHQQLVNHVSFSPDGRWLASAGFDKSVKLWEGKTGKFVETLRGHVGSVYQVTFSPDSRLLLSASKDSTCKVWNLRTKKLQEDLPGHADEVFAVDWNPNGGGGASGGKDKALKM